MIEIDGGNAVGGGEGSGFVLNKDGYIPTSFHVVDGAQQLVVRLVDGSAVRASVVGSDPRSDLAIIRAPFEADQLQSAMFGDSDIVQVGDPVFAIGNPFAKKFSVTSGIVSAVGRHTESSFSRGRIRNVIQTDAALNPGNSGGPLFNSIGEVIGVNSSITGPSGFHGNVGLGFAVPSNTAVRFLPAMLAGDEVIHSQLGVTGGNLDPLLAAADGLPVRGGFVVGAVSGAALAAGVQPGDIVISIEGESVWGIDDLAAKIDSHDPGVYVALTVLRDGLQIDLIATLQAWRD